MKFALKSINGLILAGLLVTTGAAMAQSPTMAPATAASSAGKNTGPQGSHHRMGHRDPAKMQARMDKHLTALKSRLKITAAQESAWTAFSASMTPPARMGERATTEQRAEFAKLTTPERIDKMRALRTQRMAEMTAAMDQRGEAIKSFYAVLDPEQQKIFDAEHRKMGQRKGHGGGWGHHEQSMNIKH